MFLLIYLKIYIHVLSQFHIFYNEKYESIEEKIKIFNKDPRYLFHYILISLNLNNSNEKRILNIHE